MPPLLPPVTRLPRVTSARLTRPAIGLVTLREVQVERCRFERRLARPRHWPPPWATALLRWSNSSCDTAPLSLRRCTRANSMRARSERRLEALDVGRGAIIFGLVGSWIDDEQQVAALHQAAFGERHLVDVAGYPRADLDGLHGLQPAGELVPILHRLLENLRDADLGRGGRLGGRLCAGGYAREGPGDAIDCRESPKSRHRSPQECLCDRDRRLCQISLHDAGDAATSSSIATLRHMSRPSCVLIAFSAGLTTFSTFSSEIVKRSNQRGWHDHERFISQILCARRPSPPP